MVKQFCFCLNSTDDFYDVLISLPDKYRRLLILEALDTLKDSVEKDYSLDIYLDDLSTGKYDRFLDLGG